MMPIFVQNLLVVLIVLCAAVYVVRKYLPASLRTRLVYALRRRGAAGNRLAAWFDTDASCGGGGGCGSCNSCESPAAPSSAPTEHVIKIVRR